MTITASAPGKLMLMGEYAVLYGYPGLVAAINQRIHVAVSRTPGKHIFITPQVKKNIFVKKALATFSSFYKITDYFKIETKGDFTDQIGLGSSAAVVVATLKALGQICNISIDNPTLFNLGIRVIFEVQKSGSGADVAASVYGGVLWYEKNMKKIIPVVFPPVELVVGYSGKKAKTTAMIKLISNRYRQDYRKMTIIFRESADKVRAADAALRSGNFKLLGQLMLSNHHLLQRLGVSTQKLDHMVNAAVLAGAWGAKLSGAGGGDCVIAIVNTENKHRVSKAMQSAGGEMLNIALEPTGADID